MLRKDPICHKKLKIPAGDQMEEKTLLWEPEDNEISSFLTKKTLECLSSGPYFMYMMILKYFCLWYGAKWMFLTHRNKRPFFSLPYTHTHKILVRNFLPHPSFVVANSSGADTAPSRANRTLAIAFSHNMIVPFLVTGRESAEESWKCIVGDRSKLNYMKTFSRFWFTSQKEAKY